MDRRHRRLGHDQGVVGDDDAGAAGAPGAVFDEAAAVVAAGGVDALAPVVGERIDPGAADPVGEPARQVAGDQCAVARRRQPARHEAETDRLLAARAGDGDGVVEVEQAEIVLPPLAQHGLARLLGRVRIEPVEFAVDLVLQVAREGREPDRAAVLLRPQAGRRDVADGLAHAGARFGEHDIRRVLGEARHEGARRRRRVVRLFGALFGLLRHQGGQSGARFVGRDRPVARRRLGRPLGPFRQVAPRFQAGHRAGASGIGRRDVQGRQHRAGPAPAAGRHGAGDRARARQIPGLRVVGEIGDLFQQRCGCGGERIGFFGGRVRFGQVQRGRNPGRRRQAEDAGTGEGEQVEDIPARKAPDAEPPRDPGAVAVQRQRPVRLRRQPFGQARAG